MAKHPRLSRVYLLDEIQAQGYTGKATILGDYPLKVRPTVPVLLELRYETNWVGNFTPLFTVGAPQDDPHQGGGGQGILRGDDAGILCLCDSTRERRCEGCSTCVDTGACRDRCLCANRACRRGTACPRAQAPGVIVEWCGSIDSSRSQRQTPIFRSPSPGKPGRYLRSRGPGHIEPEVDSHLHFLFRMTSRCGRMKPAGTQRVYGPAGHLHQEDAGVQLYTAGNAQRYTAIDTGGRISERYLPLESVRRPKLLSARSAGK